MGLSKAQKARNFKKGHPPYPPKEVEDTAIKESQPEKRNLSRLPEEVYDKGLNKSNEPPSILRTIRKRKIEEEIINGEYITDNRIVNMEMNAEFWSQVFPLHFKHDPTCTQPSFQFLYETEDRYGLGCAVQAYCTKCCYTSPKKPMSPQAKTTKKGRKPYVLNQRLGQHMCRSEHALKSACDLFCMLDVRCPNEKTMLDHINKAGEVTVKLAQDEMEKNKDILSQIIDHRPGEVKGIVACDTLYNNAARGANRVPGTQACIPFVEYTTGEMMPVDMQIYQQVCPVCKLGFKKGMHKGCLRNYPSPGPMSDVEKRGCKQFFNTIAHSQLKGKITHFLSDGCKQFGPVLNNKERLLCIVHIKRGQRRKFYKVCKDLPKNFFGPAGTAANTKKNTMSHHFINRCAKELTLARKQYKKDEEFFKVCQKIRHNIIKCLAGFHSGCDKASLVCRPRRNKQETKTYALSMYDMVKLQAVIDYR